MFASMHGNIIETILPPSPSKRQDTEDSDTYVSIQGWSANIETFHSLSGGTVAFSAYTQASPPDLIFSSPLSNISPPQISIHRCRCSVPRDLKSLR